MHKIPHTAARDEETPAAPFPACAVLFPLVVGMDAPDVLTVEEPPALADAVIDPELADREADPELAVGTTEPALDAPGTAVIAGWSTGWLATSHPLTRFVRLLSMRVASSLSINGTRQLMQVAKVFM